MEDHILFDDQLSYANSIFQVNKSTTDTVTCVKACRWFHLVILVRKIIFHQLIFFWATSDYGRRKTHSPITTCLR